MDQEGQIATAIRELAIAVGSPNPDPARTIGDYRRSERRKERLLVYSAVTATLAALATLGQWLVPMIFRSFGR